MVAVIAAVPVACGGDDDADEAPATVPDGDSTVTSDAPTEPAPDEPDPTDTSGPVQVTVGGESYSFAFVSCTIGDGFYGPDFRRVTASVSETDYPGISIGYAPAVDDAPDDVEPNQVTFFPDETTIVQTADPSAIDATPTPDGITGTAELDSLGTISFRVACPEDATFFNLPDDESDGGAEPTDDTSTGSEATPVDGETGIVTLEGVDYELAGPTRNAVMIEGGDASGPFDFDICETVNPAFEGDFNISGTLGDGTDYRLSGTLGDLVDQDGFELGEFPDSELVPFDEISLDGVTLSGSATTSRGPVEFTFTC